MTEDQILHEIVIPAIQEARQSLPGFPEQDPAESLSLYGSPSAVLDSLGLVSFVFLLEDVLRKALGRELAITADDILGPDVNPFSSLRALSRFLRAKIGET
jgi:hypothetical protein